MVFPGVWVISARCAFDSMRASVHGRQALNYPEKHRSGEQGNTPRPHPHFPVRGQGFTKVYTCKGG